MIFTTDPLSRERLALGCFAMYNAMLGLTEPTSLTARALGPDSRVDMVQIVQVMCAVWILAQAVREPLRLSRIASLPFCFVGLSLLVQFWFVIVVGLSNLLAAYYICLTAVFALSALDAATFGWHTHRRMVR